MYRPTFVDVTEEYSPPNYDKHWFYEVAIDGWTVGVYKTLGEAMKNRENGQIFAKNSVTQEYHRIYG